MARPGSSYMKEAPPGYRWKTVTKINAMGRPYTTRILVPIDTLEPTQPTQVPQPQTAAGIFEDSGYGEMVTDQFPGGYPGQATTPQPATPPDWRDSFVGRAPPMAKKKDITTVIKKSEDPGVATTETITIKGGLMGEPEESFQATPPPQPPSWDGSAAFADRDVGMGAGRIQLGDPRNVRAGPDLPPGYAPNPAYAPPGSSPSMRANYPSPPRQETQVAVPDPRFQRMKPGQMMNMEDPTWSGATAVNTPPPNNLPGTDFFGGGPAAPQPSGREMIAEASKQPLYVTDDGEPIYMEDVIAVGGAARLRAISRAAKPIQEAFFKMINKLKISRQRSGKPPISADKPIVKTALAGGALAAGETARRGIFRGEGEQPEGEQAVAPRVREPGDVKPTGRFPPEVIAAAQERQRNTLPPPGGRSGPLSPEVIEAARERTRNRQSPFQGRFPEEVLNREQRIQQTPFMGEGEASSQVAMSPTLPSGREELQIPREVTEGGAGSFPATKVSNNEQIAANPNLEKIWGKFAYDPAARKKYFLDGMKDIYKKAMLLNLIAVMTGGESQAAAFIEAKTAELKMVDKFDEEERITNIWKEVFTDANGNPYMPKDKREAAERAGRTGARPEVIKDIFGAVPEAKAKQQYHRVDPKDPTKWEHRRFPAGEDVPDEWVSGKAGSRSPVEGEIASIEALKYLEKLENENSPYADEYANIINARRAGKQVATGTGVSFFNKMIEEGTYTIPEGENNFSILQKFLSLPEVTLIEEGPDGPVEIVVPGWSTITGQKPSKTEIAEATGGATKTYASRSEAKSAVMAENPKPEGMSDEEYNRRIEEKVKEIYGE